MPSKKRKKLFVRMYLMNARKERRGKEKMMDRLGNER